MNEKTVASLNPSQAEDTFAQLSEVQDPYRRAAPIARLTTDRPNNSPLGVQKLLSLSGTSIRRRQRSIITKQPSQSPRRTGYGATPGQNSALITWTPS